LWKKFIEACHQENGHQGRKITAELVRRRVYFPYWRQMVDAVCATVNGSKKHRGHMQIFVADKPMERIAIDLTGEHPTSTKGFKYILTIQDAFSR
jgi:hypothetical protein